MSRPKRRKHSITHRVRNLHRVRSLLQFDLTTMETSGGIKIVFVHEVSTVVDVKIFRFFIFVVPT